MTSLPIPILSPAPPQLTLTLFGDSHLDQKQKEASKRPESASVADTKNNDVSASPGHHCTATQLHQMLNAEHSSTIWKIHNLAKGGSTSREVLTAARDFVALKVPTDCALVWCGTNDICRKFQGRLSEHVPLEEYRHNMSELLKLLNRSAGKVIVISIPPVSPLAEFDPQEEIVAYNRVLVKIAQSGLWSFVDVWTVLDTLSEKGSLDSQFPWRDELHLNIAGSSTVARALIASKVLSSHAAVCSYIRPSGIPG